MFIFATVQASHLKLMSLEVHVTTRSRLLPDPEYDGVSAIVFVISSDEGCENVCKRSGEPTLNGSCLEEGEILCQQQRNFGYSLLLL